MQLFIVSKDPAKCAAYLDDRRANKIILESAQMLSDAVRSNCLDELPNLYRKCMPKHPCSLWVAKSRENFEWTVEYWRHLNIEKYKRTTRWHSNWLKFKQGSIFLDYANKIPSRGLTTPANCARNMKYGLDFSKVKPVTLAYRLYLKERWRIESESGYFPKASLTYLHYAS